MLSGYDLIVFNVQPWSTQAARRGPEQPGGKQHPPHVLVFILFFKTLANLCYNLLLEMEGFVFPNPTLPRAAAETVVW